MTSNPSSNTAKPALDWDDLAARIVQPGFFILPKFFSLELVQDLSDEISDRKSANLFHAAGVGSKAQHIHNPNIRGDLVSWIDPTDPPAAVIPIEEFLNEIKRSLNERLMMGLWDSELHFAVYPPGTHYEKHVDRFRGDDARLLSVVIYLNEDWQPDDGGQLLLNPAEGNPIAVQPEAGTLVIFRSENLPHEVLRSNKERLSLTGWLRRRR